MKPQTILHVIDALNVGGAQKLLVQLARWTPRDEFRTVVCALQPCADMKAQIEARGASVVSLNRPRPSILSPWKLLAYIVRNIADICAICRREQVQAVHCHLSDAEFIGIAAGRLAGVPRVLSTVHYPDLLPQRRGADPRTMLRIVATMVIYRWAHYVIAVSDDVGERLKKVFRVDAAKLRVVLNGIDIGEICDATAPHDMRRELGVGPDTRVITTVARLMPPKGHSFLLDAMPRLIRKCGSVRLLLAGDGDLRRELEEKCARLGIGEHVLFLGSRQDVPRLLALTELFVLPSLWEGTSLALLEAMAAGCPVVATDIPGNRAVLKDRHSGLLVPPGDSEALYEAISFFLDTPRSAREYGLAAREEARRRFDIRNTVASLIQLWTAREEDCRR